MAIIVEGMRSRKQRTPYTCGPAALRSIFRYYGVSVPEKELVLLGDVDREGADPEQLRQLAHEYGFRFYARHNQKIANLERWLLEKVPAIVLLQDWGRNNGRSGHYTVVSGLSESSVLLADPANYTQGDHCVFTKGRRMGRGEFLDRWWDVDGGRIYRCWMAVVRPHEAIGHHFVNR
jgi:predicted double-glycine peptidase